MKTNKWSILVGITVVILTVKIFLPDVWTRVGEEIEPVFDGVKRVITPDKQAQDADIRRETFEVSNPNQTNKTNPKDEEILFWFPVGGQPQ